MVKVGESNRPALLCRYSYLETYQGRKDRQWMCYLR